LSRKIYRPSPISSIFSRSRQCFCEQRKRSELSVSMSTTKKLHKLIKIWTWYKRVERGGIETTFLILSVKMIDDQLQKYNWYNIFERGWIDVRVWVLSMKR
jgi:hypothetical protein